MRKFKNGQRVYWNDPAGETSGEYNGFRQCLPQDDEEEDIDEVALEDAYNPYMHLETQALEHEDVTVISDEEFEKEEGYKD